MERRKKLLLTLGSLHLILVVCGASQVDFTRFKIVGRGIAAYGAATGAGAGYGFFAPGVGTELRATFEVTDAQGNRRVETLGGPGGRELDLRVGNFVTKFWDHVADAKARRALTASWAAKVFSRRADARNVTVRLEEYDLPDAESWSRGERPRWTPFYEAKYAYTR